MHTRLLTILLLVIPCTIPCAWSQKPVTLDALSGSRTRGAGGGAITWTPDSKSFAYTEGKGLMLYDAATQKKSELANLEALDELVVASKGKPVFDWENRRVREDQMQWTPDGRRFLYAQDGDIFLWDQGWKQLTATPDQERDARLSPDGNRVAFRRDNDLYVITIATKQEQRITTGGSDLLRNGRLDWVYPEELSLSRAFWWSPDSQSIAYLQFDVSKQMTHPHVDMVTANRAVYEPERYPKAGSPNADVKLGVVSAAGGETKWMSVAGSADTLLARVDWTPDSKELFVQKLPRVQNRLELLAVNVASGSPRTVLEEKDWAWINVHSMLRFLPNTNQFLWASERSGFRHLYIYSLKGELQKQITSGDWEVSEIAAINEKEQTVYFTSTAASPLERHLYSASFKGGDLKKLTTQAGTHSISMSPNGAFFMDTHSSFTEPSGRTLHDSTGKQLAVYRERDRKVLADYQILPTEIVQVKSEFGDTMYARMIKPPNFDLTRKYPAIVMVYGGPGAQTVRNSFAGLSWDQALAHKGFVIWQMDNHGSAGRGHKWESRVFRRLGEQELSDQKVGLAHLISMGFVDPNRLGMYGWSYGGFMTLYTLFNSPKTFKAGIAGAPVTDWRHYDTIYTERYMDIPGENSAGYKYSSPLNQAANLEAKLMIVHNIEDDNVLFQNSMQMMDALQQANKPFETMIYPQKNHGVSGPASKHMLQTLTSFFERTLN